MTFSARQTSITLAIVRSQTVIVRSYAVIARSYAVIARSYAVIARSKATKQSPAWGADPARDAGDCFVASLLAMTGSHSQFSSHTSARSWPMKCDGVMCQPCTRRDVTMMRFHHSSGIASASVKACRSNSRTILLRSPGLPMIAWPTNNASRKRSVAPAPTNAAA